MSLLSDLFSKRNKTPAQTGAIDLFSAPVPVIVPRVQPTKHLTTTQKILGETIPKDIDDEEPDRRHPQETQEQRQEKLSRTVFVGNVQIETTRKALQKLFSEHGTVEKVWFRSAPVDNGKIGPKASFILKKFKDNAEAMNAYVRFEKVEEAESALKKHNFKHSGLTLRVSLAGEKAIDNETTVFIGNLPFDVKDEELRKFCQGFGTVEDIRVVRNSFSHQGIGIAYVKYATKEMMKNGIVKINNADFKGRKLRAKKSVDKKRLQKKQRKLQQKKKLAKPELSGAARRIQQRKQEQAPAQKLKQNNAPVANQQNQQQNPKAATKSPAPKPQPQIKQKTKKQPAKEQRTKKKQSQEDKQEEQLRKQVEAELKKLRQKPISKN